MAKVKERNDQPLTMEEIEKQSNIKEFFKRLGRNKLAVTGGIIFLVVCLLAILAPVIAPYDYMTMDLLNKNAPPSAAHLFGTDQYGRDILSRLLYGGRWSLTLGLGASLISTVGCIIVGSIAGYFGGWVDNLVMRICDVFQCIPGILLTVCMCTLMGPGLVNTMIAMSFGGIWGGARMLRGQILTVRNQEYVEAARATNNSNLRTIVKYILPNSIQPTIIGMCMGVGGNIMAASGLSFLGLGIQPPLPEWGAMLNDGRNVIRYFPNQLIGPMIVISAVVLSVSIFGDGLRDAIDPRMNE